MKKSALFAFVILAGLVHASGYTTKTITAKKAGVYETSASYIVWPGKSPLEKFANKTLAAWAVSEQKKWIAGTLQVVKEQGKTNGTWEYEQGMSPVRGDIRVISVTAGTYEYSGGAHPNHGSDAFNFALIDGKPKLLKIEDLFRKGAKPGKMLSDKILKKLEDEEGAEWVHNGDVKVVPANQLNRFTIGMDGLTWYFNPYEMGPYVSGDFEVKLTWQELGPDLNRALVMGR